MSIPIPRVSIKLVFHSVYKFFVDCGALLINTKKDVKKMTYIETLEYLVLILVFILASITIMFKFNFRFKDDYEKDFKD